MWAVEKYIGHWDGYAGERTGEHSPNNYYLYSDPAGRFQMLPWGTDQTWDLKLEIPTRIDNFDTEGGLMFNLCLDDEDCSRAYWEALGEVTDAVEAMDAGAFLTATAAMLAAWQQRERESGRAESSAGEVTAAVNEAATFIDNRPGEARDWLAANEPPPPPPPGDEPDEPRPEPSPVVEPIPGASPIAVAPVRLVHLGRVERTGAPSPPASASTAPARSACGRRWVRGTTRSPSALQPPPSRDGGAKRCPAHYRPPCSNASRAAPSACACGRRSPRPRVGGAGRAGDQAGRTLTIWPRS